jgi:hypothetical protein
MLRWAPMINLEVSRNPGENALGVLRRFSRKVQSSGVIPRVRSLRFNSRTLSHYKVKMKTLKNLARRAEMAELIKLGKAPVKPTRK